MKPDNRQTGTMQQLVLDHPGADLRLVESAIPQPGPGQVLLEVSACAICEIDPLIVTGEIRDGAYPLVPGHEIVGYVLDTGGDVAFRPGQRVGVAWLGGACGNCWYCGNELDHLCAEARVTGLHLNGGYATHAIANARYCYAMDDVRVGPSPDTEAGGVPWSEDVAMAPLLCEGSLAFRSYKACRSAGKIGLYGFGTAAQLVCQMAKAEGHEVYAMTRAGGEPLLDLARALGADWTGTVDQLPPALLDAAILLQPTVELVPHVLSAVRRNGTLVFLGMHQSRVPAFPFDLFRYEHNIHSIARVAHADRTEFLDLCARMTLKTRVKTYPFLEASRALKERPNSKHGESVLAIKSP